MRLCDLYEVFDDDIKFCVCDYHNKYLGEWDYLECPEKYLLNKVEYVSPLDDSRMRVNIYD